MAFTVFYAWQSDRHEKLCRYFIRDAAKAAVERVARDYTVADAPAFDQSTEGESGLVHIADTIKRKISECSAFIADFTHVGNYETDDEEPRRKRATNANVAIEFGYAMHDLRPRQIILVMNTAFGSPEDLPFDLKHYSFPIQYSLASPDDPNKATIRKNLSDSIQKAIKLLIDSGLLEERERREREREESLRAQATKTWHDFVGAIRVGHFQGFGAPDRVPYMTYALIPLTHTNGVDLAPVRDMLRELPLIRPANHWASRDDHVRAKRRVEIEPPTETEPEGRYATEGVVEVEESGSILAAERMDGTRLSSGKGYDTVDYMGCERKLVEHVTRYVQILRGLKVEGPLLFGLRLHQLSGCKLIVGPKDEGFDRCEYHEVNPRVLAEIPAEVDGQHVQQVAKAMKVIFDRVWQSVGARGCLSFNEKGEYDLRTE